MTTMPRRVMIFAMAFPPSAVGTGIYAQRLARGLAEKGIELLVLAPGDGEECTSFDRGQPYRTVRMPATGFVPYRYLLARKWLRRMLREFRPEVLWTTNGMATRVVGLLGDLPDLETAVISCVRGSDIVTRLPGWGLWKRLESVPQRRCYKHSAAIAAASEYMKKVAIAKGVNGEKIFVGPPAFDFGLLENYRFDPERLWKRYPFVRERPVVLTVGRLSEQKQVELAVRAVARVVERLPDLCHVVVGDGPQRGELRKLVGELGLEENVFLVGRVPPMSAELFDLFRWARVFLLPSVREGLGNVFLEAGAFGLPCVGVNDGGVPEVVQDGETGLLAAPGDIADIGDKVAQLVEDAELARRMGGRAREWIEERFGVEVMVERSLRALNEVMESGNAAQRGEG
jgi:glycosyltransferase involved in cell wall biosynthesis